MKLSNDNFLSKAIAKFGPYFSQGQLSPSMLPPITGQQARPFMSVHNGYVPQDQNAYPSPSIPRPPPYQSPRTYETAKNPPQDQYHSYSRGVLADARHTDTRGPIIRNEQDFMRSNGREVISANRKNPRNQQASGKQSSQNVYDQEDDVTPKKKVSFRSVCNVPTDPLTAHAESNEGQG